tara:strand:- start:11113 stop:11520 length:408 start_codon:yes stop_codon:yes gene_type:complete
MSSHVGLIDELERDLGLSARLRILANAGGQRRYVPMPDHVENSSLTAELGEDICCWLAGRYGGETVIFPSRKGYEREDDATLLRAAVLDAGLTEPSRSANDIAAEFGVSERWVRNLRAELREDMTPADLPLFTNK